MKYKIFLLTLSCLITHKFFAQTTAHPTIDSVKVLYKHVPLSTGSVQNNRMIFNVIPEAYIKLKNTNNLSKIYFKIYSTVNDSLLYQVQYDLNSSTLVNAEGKTLFEKSGQKVHISPGTVMPLKRYTYKLQTEDNHQVLSTQYSIIQ